MPSSGTRDTRTTATIARTMPTRTSAGGTPSSDDPGGDRDERGHDAVIGATTPIRPTARPW